MEIDWFHECREIEGSDLYDAWRKPIVDAVMAFFSLQFQADGLHLTTDKNFFEDLERYYVTLFSQKFFGNGAGLVEFRNLLQLSWHSWRRFFTNTTYQLWLADVIQPWVMQWARNTLNGMVHGGGSSSYYLTWAHGRWYEAPWVRTWRRRVLEASNRGSRITN